MIKLSILTAAASVVLLSACATTPSVEQVNAQNAKMEADCEAKGHRRGTPDFDTCRSLALQAEAQNSLNTMAAAQMGIFGLTLLSDARLKRDLVPLKKLSDGIQLYRFRYLWSDQLYVGVMAQDVLPVAPDAVVQGPDGYLRVNYALLGMKLLTWNDWLARPRQAANFAPGS